MTKECAYEYPTTSSNFGDGSAILIRLLQHSLEETVLASLIGLSVSGKPCRKVLFQAGIRSCGRWIPAQVVTKEQVAFPFLACPLKHMQVMRARVAFDEIMAAWNAVLAFISIAKLLQQRNTAGRLCKVCHRHAKVQNGLGRQARNSSAADMLYVENISSQTGKQPLAFCQEKERPVRLIRR